MHLALSILRTLRANAHTAYLAGGCVRDLLLAQSPKDYDVATDATPDRLRALFPRTSEVGAAFGVVLVKDGSAVVEVATFRADGPYSDRRRPDAVHFSTPHADALRRDFTINALFLDPLDPHHPPSPPAPAVIPFNHPTLPGIILDYVGGVPDLHARLIRAVGDPDQRFQEDDLRTLRAVRFAARLAFSIHPDTAAAIRRHAGDLQGISRERVGDELRRMFAHPARAAAARMLAELALDAPALTLPHAHPATTPALGALPRCPFATALAAWLLDRDPAAGPAHVAACRAALCLSNDEQAELAATLAAHAKLPSYLTLPIPPRKRLAVTPGFDGALAILAGINPHLVQSIRADLQALSRTFGGLNPPPLLTGDALIAAGFAPGPAFKSLLDRVYDAQLEGKCTSIEALELARRLRVD